LIVEGLVLALAASRMEDILRKLSTVPVDQRRISGLVAVAGGVIVLGLARGTLQ
jgi:uncharacterized protein YjeT (DUF2065 family)